MKIKQIALTAALVCAATGAFAQTSSVTLYGSLDQYFNYLKSSADTSTNTIRSLNDGSTMRSRIGFKGVEDLGDGLAVKFQLEGGLGADTGASADTTRFFDRQAWVGLASTTLGEVRFGRQNGSVFARGDYVDYTSRTLGSVVNAFGVPSRYDNDISYVSPRLSGFQFDGHYALAETTVSTTNAGVYQLGADYLNGPFRVGYASITGKAPKDATYTRSVTYRQVYGNYDYGQGKVYATFIRTNNSTSSGTAGSATFLSNGSAILGNVGGTVAGTKADVNRYYNIIQLSADYKVTPQLRVGALYGVIKDTSDNKMGAKGGAIGAYYDLSKRTTLVASLSTLNNDDNGSFQPSGSAGLATKFTTAADVTGKRINDLALGIVHRF
ncbi:porin [Aquabacterium sp.]|uniref:porin n=1 Tax=Aquabacterium sp. TaxID=1872578 RepID=UPI0025BC8527|nr:porin [Aquabacterium sp.]